VRYQLEFLLQAANSLDHFFVAFGAVWKMKRIASF